MKLLPLLAAYVALIISFPSAAQSSDAEYFSALATKGYTRYIALPFGAIGPQSAATQLTSKNGEPESFFANISADKEGGGFGFKAASKCVPEPGNVRGREHFLVVNGQKITSRVYCMRAPDGQVQEVYVIATQEGIGFIRDEFLSKSFVFVYLNDIAVPFRTEGFNQAWKLVAGKAL